LRRPNGAPCQLPMRYMTYKPFESGEYGGGWDIASGCVTVFKRDPQVGDQEGFHLPENDEMRGNKKLYEWLRKNGLFESRSLPWRPLQDKDAHQVLPPLHRAIIEGQESQIEECLKRDDDIDESDSKGRTALHYAVARGAYPVFKLLLSRGARVELSNAERHTPLHEAARSDQDGQFIRDLLAARAEVNARVDYGETPLSCAVKARNLQAVEVLMQAEAEISPQESDSLEDPVFSSLHDRGIIPPSKTGRGGLADICKWIEKGDCVVLHYQGYQGMTYYSPKPNRVPRLIFADINPDTDLLSDGEWPSVLKREGYTHTPYDAEMMIREKAKFSGMRRFRFGY
jgi:ankyrin repeat protein